MRILYETTIADLFAYERYRYNHSPSSKPRGMFVQGCQLLIASLQTVLLYPFGRTVGLLESLMALAVLYFIWGAIFRSIRRLWYRKSVWQIFREAKTHGLLGPRELELEGDNLIEVSDYHIQSTPLDAVEKIVTTDEYAFIYTGETTAFVIPRRYLSENDFRSFVRLVAHACTTNTISSVSRDAVH